MPRDSLTSSIRAGLLTPFQVNQLLQGRGADLVLGPYRLLDRMGEGGMGQVFKAQHEQLGRIVALKVIRKDKLADPNISNAFSARPAPPPSSPIPTSSGLSMPTRSALVISW